MHTLQPGPVAPKTGNDESAEAALKQAAALEPANLDFLFTLADFYLKRGRWSEAERTAETMLAADPSHEVGRKSSIS